MGDMEEDLYKALIFGNQGINQGMILENIVAQMLRASGHELYFHEYMYQPEGNTVEKKYEIRYIIYMKDLKYEEGIMYIPVYMTMMV